jgi:hypothetical protein
MRRQASSHGRGRLSTLRQLHKLVLEEYIYTNEADDLGSRIRLQRMIETAPRNTPCLQNITLRI